MTQSGIAFFRALANNAASFRRGIQREGMRRMDSVTDCGRGLITIQVAADRTAGKRNPPKAALPNGRGMNRLGRV